MSKTTDAAARLREKLEQRRERRTTTDLQRIPFTLDQAAADRVEELGRLHQQLEGRLDRLHEQDAERDPDGGDADVRANGQDMSELGREIATAEAEAERVLAELEEAVAVARDEQVHLVFERLTSADYERLLIKHGGAEIDSSVESSIAFHDALLEAAFRRIEMADGEDGGYDSWVGFAEAAQLSFGELDPIRALVYASNRRGSNSVPFSSTPSKKMKSS